VRLEKTRNYSNEQAFEFNERVKDSQVNRLKAADFHETLIEAAIEDSVSRAEDSSMFC
jgi:hypothetical protein